MKKWLGRAFLGLAALYLIAAMVARLIPLETPKKLLEQGLNLGEGWTVSVGRVRTSLWRGPALDVENFSLYHTGIGSQLEILHVDAARVQWPLLDVLRGRKSLRLLLRGPRLLVAQPLGQTQTQGAQGLEEVGGNIGHASARTLKTTLAALATLHRQMAAKFEEEGRGYWIDQVDIEGASARLFVPPLLGGEPQVVAVSEAFLLILLPRDEKVGAVSGQGVVRVGIEERPFQLTGLLRNEAIEGETRDAWILPELTVRLGEIALNAAVRVDGSPGTVAVKVTDAGPVPAEAQSGALRLELSLSEGLEALGPLWTPLLSPGFPWKLLGGARLNYSTAWHGPQQGNAFDLDLTDAGILRGGLFHKPRGIAARLSIRTESSGAGGQVLPSSLEVGPLGIVFSGRYEGEGPARTLRLSFQGRADSLVQLAGLVADGTFATADPSGLAVQGAVLLLGDTSPEIVVEIASLALASGSSDLHVSGRLNLNSRRLGAFRFSAGSFTPGDWLAEGARGAMGPLAPLLSVAVSGLSGKVTFDERLVALEGMRGRWASGPLLVEARYRRDHCRGEGGLLLRGARLEQLAEAAGVEPVDESLSGTLSVQSEFGRDDPCTAGSPGPFSSWGANAQIRMLDMDYPVLDGASKADLDLIERLSGARLHPLPRVRSAEGVLRWQGGRGVLDRFFLDAGPMQLTIAGSLGQAGEGLDLGGALRAPRSSGAPPLLQGVEVDGDHVKLPLRLAGSWSDPQAELLLDSQDVRNALLKATGVAPFVESPIPTVPPQQTGEVP